MPLLAAVMVPHPPLIVPEIGRGEETKIAATVRAYTQAAELIASLKPELIVLTSPHSLCYADYFHISPGSHAEGDFGQFNAPQVRFSVEYDTDFTERLERRCSENKLAAGTKGIRRAADNALDHGTMVPLSFINRFYKEFKLVRIGLSGLGFAAHYQLGQYIRQIIEETGRRTVFVASGDLSHVLTRDGPYGYKPEGPVYDKRIMETMSAANFGELLSYDPAFCEKAAQCGHRSFIIMAGALDRSPVEPHTLSYEGPFGVGYGICTYTPAVSAEKNAGASENVQSAGSAAPSADAAPAGSTAGFTFSAKSRNFLDQYYEAQKVTIAEKRAKEDPYVQIARKTVEIYVRTGKTPKIAGGCIICDDDSFTGEHLLPDMMNRRAGTFVSIHKEGELRGCIGTISATRPTVAEEIVHNAVSASTQDPRFPPVAPDELDKLEYSVDVLGPTESIASPKELDVKKYGVIVTKGYRRGLLLPNLDGVDTVEQQLDIACRKGDITMDENPDLERFEVVRHL